MKGDQEIKRRNYSREFKYWTIVNRVNKKVELIEIEHLLFEWRKIVVGRMRSARVVKTFNVLKQRYSKFG